MKIVLITFVLALIAMIAGADEKPTDKVKVVLPPEWKSIEIHTGGGSCWGESTGLYLTFTRTEGGADVTISARGEKAKSKPRALNSDELKEVTDRLVDYCTYFSGSGYRAPNSWLLHRIDYVSSDGGHGTLLDRPALIQDSKSEEFHIWLRSLHPEAEPLQAETYWMERRQREAARAKEKQAEQAGAGQPATRTESKSGGNDNPNPDTEGRSR